MCSGQSPMLSRLPQLLALNQSEEVVKRLTGLHQAAAEMSAFVHEYDYSPSFPANGFRSFLKILTCYFEKLTEAVDNEASVSIRRRNRTLRDLLDFSLLLTKQVELMRLVRSKDVQLNANDLPNTVSAGDGPLEVNAIVLEILHLLLSFDETDVLPLFSSVRNFWLCPESRKVMDMFLNHTVAKTMPVHQLLMMLFDSSVRMRAGAKYSLQATIQEQKMVWSLLDEGVGRAITKLRFLSSAGRAEFVHLVRNNQKYSAHSISKTAERRNEPVEAMLVSYNGKGVVSDQKCDLIFHCAGGGYISVTPRGHEPYLRCWSKMLKTPVICPNYGKAPENPFPQGLQDLLDSYLYICSQAEEVAHMLGFHPENIVLTGDSAGGNLALALLLILNDLKKEQPAIPMPKSVFLAFPAANASIDPSPSRCSVTFDPILTVAATLGIGAAYPGLEPDPAAPPWFRRTRPEVLETFRQISKFSRDPYFNPLVSDQLHELRQIPLFIQMCEFDPLLDDSIAIAKAWKGPVHLHLASGLTHGYLFSVGQKFVEEALLASVDMLSQSLAFDPSHASQVGKE